MRRIFFLFLILWAAACSQPPSPSKSLKISFNTYPATFDPRKSGDFVSATLICLIYEGLTRCLPDGSAEFALARSVDISEDQKTYTFHLRDAVWSDGEPITAYDFEKSWKKIIDPSFPSISAYLLYPIKNGEKCAKGELPLTEAGIKALDRSTFRIELERPTPYFFSLTAFPLFLPIPSHVEEKDPNWEQAPLVCSGPFLIEKSAPNSEISLIKNSKFWNRGQIALDKIDIAIVADETTALQMFEQGDLDWIGGPFSPIPPDALDQLKTRYPIHFIPSAASTLCSFNTETFPFSNGNLRKAFSYAIDREKLVQDITQGAQIPAFRCLPPTLFGKKNKKHFSFDPLQARLHFSQAMEELGISPSDLSSLTLYYKPGQIEARLVQALQKQWKESLGVEIHIQQLDFKTHQQTLQKRNYQIALASWIANFHDPVNLLERFKDKKNPKNYPGWEDAQFQAILDQAALAADSEKRFELLESAESIFADHSAVSPSSIGTAPASTANGWKRFQHLRAEASSSNGSI